MTTALFCPDPLEAILDSNGAPISGAQLYFYETGTTTSLAVYSDATLVTPLTQPVLTDSSGRLPNIFLDATFAYRCKVYDAASALIRDIDPVNRALFLAQDFPFEFLGTVPPQALQVVGLLSFVRSLTFPANFAGSHGHIGTAPTASFTITVKKNAATIGTIVIDTGGNFTFATSGGTAVSVVAGDYFTFTGPTPADATALNIAWTLTANLVL